MGKNLLLKGGTLVDPSQNISGSCDLLIESGIIKELAPDLDVNEDYADSIDLTGKIITPGMVDLHVHLREPGEEAKETIVDGSAAALAGGVTSLCCMPNTVPPVDNPLLVEYIKEKSQKAGLARVYPIGTLTRGREGKEMSDYASLLAAGAMAFSDDGNYLDNSRLMFNIFQYLKQFEGLVISHCEEATLADEGVAHEGYDAHLLGLPGIPAVAESIAVSRDIMLAEATGGRIHIAHVSCAESVECIRRAKEKGVKVTAEVTPHHLLLTDASLEGFDPMAKMKPPLRTKKDQQALLDGLKEGIIDIIATDHAPHTLDDKDRLFSEAAFGVTSLDFVLSLLLTELVHPGKLTLEELIKCYSCRPAEIVGLPGGTLKKDAAADIAVIDLHAEGIIDSTTFYSRGANTPFQGRRIKGKPVMVFVQGELKMEDGKVWN